MTERTILVLVLRVMILFFATQLILALPYLIPQVFGRGGIGPAWAVFGSLVLPNLLLLVGCFVVWVRPWLIVGRYEEQISEKEISTLNSSELMAGAISIMGVYLVVDAVQDLFNQLWQFIPAVQDLFNHSYGHTNSTAFLPMFSRLLLLAGGLVLIYRRDAVVRYLNAAGKAGSSG